MLNLIFISIDEVVWNIYSTVVINKILSVIYNSNVNGKILYYNADLVNILIITYMWRGTSFNQIMFELRTTPFLWQEYKIY